MFKNKLKSLFGTNLYTWGKSTGALGYKVPAATSSIMLPQQVKGFNNVAQVVMGYNHSALVTSEGKLYTWGPGNYGVLGHNDDKSYEEPKLVDFFEKNNLKVSAVSLGEYHTVAVTTDGDVWTWGYGGRQQNMLMDLLFLQVGALGHGDLKTRYTPTPVKALRELPPTKEVHCGLRFTNALNVNNEMFVWGKGDYGVFGDGNNKSLKAPIKNDYFEGYLKEKLKLSIRKMLSCNNYSMALMSDGQVYGWGSNENGQMGIKTEIGVEIYETASFPTVAVGEFGNANIIDLAVGEDIVAVLLDNNEVFWSGMKIAYKFERFPLPSGIGKITHIGCCHRCVVVVTEDGDIYYKQKFLQEQDEDLQTGVMKSTVNKMFGGGKLIDIGGTYRNRFALVEQ